LTIISHRHRLVFIAVPKSASHSIRFALRDQLGPIDEEQVSLFVRRRIDHPVFAAMEHGHQLAREVRDALGAERWSAYRSFAVVRNPWERFVSYVAFMMRHNGSFEREPRGAMRRVLANPQNQSAVHYRPQSDFVTDETGRQIVTRLCRAERLQADFDELCDEFGLERRELGIRNASSHVEYTQYYDDELVRLVADQYRQDVERFGYRFGD
jgi:hypothetical protein